MGIKLVEPTVDLLRDIADNMRDEDVVEVKASNGHTPHEALAYSVRLSHKSWVVLDDTCVPIAVMGYSKPSLLGSVGHPWLLSSNNILRSKRLLLTESKPIVAHMLRDCSTLYNYVHRDNHLSIRWLKWLGFSFGEVEPHGVNGELFYRFEMRRDHV